MPATVVVPLDESGETFPYDFGTVQLHDRKSVTFHFANDGQHELKVLGHDATGDFATRTRHGSSHFGTPAVLQNLEVVDVQAVALPNQEIRVSVTFVAQRAGEHHGKLQIFVNAANLGAIVIPIHARVEVFRLVVVQPSPAVLDLGPVAIESTANATLLVRNDSSTAAWMDQATFSNPSVGTQIAVQTGGIASGQTRIFALEYRPSFVGPLDTDVILHFTDGSTPPQHAYDVTVKLTAIGFGAQAVFAPVEFDFGPAPIGADGPSTRITLRNIGLEPLALAGPLIAGDFRLVSPLPATVAGGQSVQLEILFRPLGAGSRDSSFSVSSNSVYAPTPVALHGVGVVEPVLRATPSAVAFADTVIGSTRVTAIVVSNPGAVAVPIGTVSVQAPGDFRIVRDTCAGETLAVGATCGVDVEFAPAAVGARATALEISGPTRPLNTPLSGRGLTAQGLVPDISDVDFGDVAVGAASKKRRVVFTNRAATDANVTSIVALGPSAAEVSIVETDCTGAVLPPGASCQVSVQLQPAAIGTRSATLTALADVFAHEATLHGLGRGVMLAWNLETLDFGNMVIGVQTPAQDASLRNTGNATLTILQVDITQDAGDFVITELTPGITSLPRNGEKGYRIRFKPTATGNRQALLRIHSDTAESPYVLTLLGVGVVPR